MDRERAIPNQTVIVRGDRIVEIGPANRVKVPEGGTRVDGRGKYLIPGLAEMHAHIPGGEAPDSLVERMLFLYVSGGITTMRGMLGHPRHLEYRARAARDELVSPTIYTSGPSLNGNSVPTPEAAAKAVTEQKAAGYDFLKIHPGIKRRGVRYAGRNRAPGRHPIRGARPARCRRGARARGRSTGPSTTWMDTSRRWCGAGAPVDASQSAFFALNLAEYVDESKMAGLVAATKKAGVWNVATEVLMDNLIVGGSAEDLAARPEMRFVTPATLAEWAETKATLLQETGASAESARRMIELRRKLIKALHAGGAGLLLGSDAPQMYNVPGFSTHRELEALVAAGLTPYQALETGTRNVAVFFGTLKDDRDDRAREAGRPGPARRRPARGHPKYHEAIGRDAPWPLAAAGGDRREAGRDRQIDRGVTGRAVRSPSSRNCRPGIPCRRSPARCHPPRAARSS